MRSIIAFALLASLTSSGLSQSWNGYGGNAQHSGLFNGLSQPAGKIHWQTPLDDDRSYYGTVVFMHYASPMITSANTVVYGYRYTTTVNGNPFYDNWKTIARSAKSGNETWELASDYSAPAVYPADWTTVFPMTLAPVSKSTGMVVAAAGGSVLIKASADSSSSSVNRVVFYTSLADYTKNASAYAPIKINTPLTADGIGNVYFGYTVTGSIPANVASLGTGGVARINVNTGASIFQSVSSLGIDSSLERPAMNAAPAVSNNGNSVYFALTGGKAILAKLDSSTLSTQSSVSLLDPSIIGAEASLINESSASPMVGPDGHVFMGVFGNQWRESHGWMLQFDADLNQLDSSGKTLPVGAFGWDDTPSVVPANLVPSYKGKSSYLILTKYNNYDDNGSDPGADGSNKIAIIDPGSNSVTHDRQSGIPVMNEIITVLGPNKTNSDPNHPNATFEWCINSAAVDMKTKSAIINSEDGHLYRWDFTSNSITESVELAPATTEAYTSTSIGPDGQIYAINNANLFAIGTATGPPVVSVYQGTTGTGTVNDILYLDGLTYRTNSIGSPAGMEAAIEADFTFASNSISNLTVNASAAAASGVTGYIYAYNYNSQSFDVLSATALSANQTSMNAVVSSNASKYLGPKGVVKILVRGVLPPHVSNKVFTLAADLISCNVK